MPKTRQTSPDVETFLLDYPETPTALVELLRGLLKSTLPELLEVPMPGWKLIGYRLPIGRSTRYLGYIAPKGARVAVGFEHGILLDDPEGQLTGKGSQVRELVYERVEDVDGESLRAFLLQAKRVLVDREVLKASLGRRDP